MNVEETSPSKPAAAVPNRKSGGTGDRPDRSDTDSREALDALLGDQLEYYQARAGEYDQWFLREGRYDRGEELNQLWFEEVALVQAALARAHPGGRVLELACGTGLWTEQLLGRAVSLTAVDGSAKMLEEHRRRLDSSSIERIEADLFAWDPRTTYDLVFFGFWLSHVPPARLPDFLSLVRRALAPGGRFFFVDSRYHDASTARDHRLSDRETGIQERKLNDGRTYRIVKMFWSPEELTLQLRAAGLTARIEETPNFFVHATGGMA